MNVFLFSTAGTIRWSVLYFLVVAIGSAAPQETKDPDDSPEEQRVGAIKHPGEWTLSAGVRLVVKQDSMGLLAKKTTATLHWPAQKDQPARHVQIAVAGHWFHLSSSSRVNFQPWAIAWEADKPVIWIATGHMGQWKTPELAYLEGAKAGVTRVSFENPDRIERQHFSGWIPSREVMKIPNQPSTHCKARLNKLLRVPPHGQKKRRHLEWATSNPVGGEVDSLRVLVTLSKHDNLFNVGPSQPLKDRVSLEGLPDALRKESARIQAQWKKTLAGMPPEDRKEIAVREVRPHSVISAPPEVANGNLEKVVAVCREAGVGPAL